ncbi:hypothetical protein AALB16_11775 [Lachnospiraceae bacterium 62-35]
MRRVNYRSRRCVYFFIMLLFFGGIWFGINLMNVKSRELEACVEELGKEYKRKKEIFNKRAEYVYRTKEYTEAFSRMMECYPLDITDEGQIEFAIGLEKELGTKITSLSSTRQEKRYEFLTSSESGEPYVLIESTMKLPVTCDYAAWKHMLDYIFSWKDKSAIYSISVYRDEKNGKIKSEILVKQYGIIGEYGKV